MISHTASREGQHRRTGPRRRQVHGPEMAPTPLRTTVRCTGKNLGARDADYRKKDCVRRHGWRFSRYALAAESSLPQLVAEQRITGMACRARSSSSASMSSGPRCGARFGPEHGEVVALDE